MLHLWQSARLGTSRPERFILNNLKFSTSTHKNSSLEVGWPIANGKNSTWWQLPIKSLFLLLRFQIPNQKKRILSSKSSPPSKETCQGKLNLVDIERISPVTKLPQPIRIIRDCKKDIQIHEERISSVVSDPLPILHPW